MNYIIDIIFAALFVIIVIAAAKKGFFMTLFELAAYVVSLIGAKLLSSAFAPQVYNAWVRPVMEKTLMQNLGEVGEKDIVGQTAAAIDSIPASLDGVLSMIGINREALVESVSQSEFAGKNVTQNLMNRVVTPVSTAIIQTILFILLVIVLSFVLRLVIRSLNKMIKNLPALKQINTSLGAVLGIVKGILVIVVLALIVGSLSGVFGNERFVETVNDSFVVGATRRLLDSISGYKF